MDDMNLARLGMKQLPSSGAAPESAFVPDYLGRVERTLSPLLENRIQTLVLSEVEDAASIAVLDRVLARLGDERHLHARLDHWPDAPEPLLQQLLDSWGLEADEKSSGAELRALLELFVSHQAAKGRICLLAGPLSGEPVEGVRMLLEWLSGLRHGGEFSVRLLLLGEGEVPGHLRGTPTENSPSRRTGAVQFPALGPEEARHYVHTRLKAAGCAQPAGLIDDELCRLAGAYASGRPGALDRLLDGALEMLTTEGKDPRITQGELEVVATRLGLELVTETLTSDTSPQQALDIGEAQLRMSLEGEAASEIALNQSRMVMGREQDCDICIESRFISRFQCLFMLTRRGWYVMDLGSTNGTYVNARRIREHLLRDGDMITIGRHQILFCQAGTGSRAIEEGDYLSTEVLANRERSGSRADDSTGINRRIGAPQ